MLFYLTKISYPKRSKANPTIPKQKMRMNPFPFAIANREPNQEPVTLQTAIGIAMLQIIFPFNTNRVMEPKFVAKLTNLA